MTHRGTHHFSHSATEKDSGVTQANGFSVLGKEGEEGATKARGVGLWLYISAEQWCSQAGTLLYSWECGKTVVSPEAVPTVR